MEKKERLLSGVRVVELATFIAAPTCTKAMADWGAEVIKIESPYGDPMRFTGGDNLMPIDEDENPGFDLENSNKKGIVINLKSPKGMEAFDKLIGTADVFVTNLRSNALQKLGISYEQLSERYPEIIFAQVLGYGEEGPAKDKPGYDFTAFAARGGILGTLYEEGTVPMNCVPGIGDHQCGMFLASGICASLFNRTNTGKGEKVTVSLYNAALYTMGIMVTSAQYGNAYPISKRNLPNPLLKHYMTKDNRCLQMAIPQYDKYIRQLLDIIGIPELIEDDRFSTFKNLKGNTALLTDLIQERILGKNVDEWLQLFEEADLPCEKAYLWDEILEDEQAWANDYLRKVEYANGNSGVLVNTPVKFKYDVQDDFRLAPKIGEHTEEILASLGYSESEMASMHEAKDIKIYESKLAAK